MTSNNLNLFILVIVTVAGWYLIRSTMFNPGDKLYNYAHQHGYERHITKEKFVSLDEIKDILDEAFVSASEILADTESAKSILELEKGVKYLRRAIRERNKLTGENPDRLPKMKLKQPKAIVDPNEVCPEKYNGKWDYPFYLRNIPFDSNCNAPPLKEIVTIVFNFVNEIPISKAAVLFEDIFFCMYKDLNFIAIVNSGDIEIPKLKEYAKSKLPGMNIIEHESSENNQGTILHEALSKISTAYVVVTRNTERFDNFSTIVRLVRDISLGKASVVSGAHRNTSGHWKAGCYQMKKLRGELSFDEGYDLSDNGCMFCDYVSGPFGVKKSFFLEYLSTKKQSTLKGDFFYMQFFNHVRLTLQKRIHMCIDSMFYTQTSGLLALEKTKWQAFVKESGISKVTMPDHKTTYEFTCSEVNLQCVPREDEDLPFCCFKYAERILSDVKRYLEKKRINYKFVLPGVGLKWKNSNTGNVKKNTIFISVAGGNLNELKIDGFSWDVSGHELLSSEWQIVFIKEEISKLDVCNIKFNEISLPVNGNPGKALVAYGKDSCTKEKICFDLLHFYGSLDSQKVWM